eukprot:TRINITY_DN7175_c0_g1_i1.p1 TRINITY_DN7175_c0_g1~~TRINITY_DN7175_c0_g1_i1.p1  ORF type:complete len:149 (-),score=21.79 TRINITY_DN7175_c0_g1_i1:276-722(-)
MENEKEPAIGIPYAHPAKPVETVMVPPSIYSNPYQAGIVPSNAIYGHPAGIPLRETVYRDTPAPFECPHCAKPGVTEVKSNVSLAACVACMMPFMLGICFLCPGMDCLWNKEHYCPNCGQKVADFKKSDPCAVVDVPHWIQESFALPA